MIRKFLCVFALANISLASAQDGTTSPYSFYGIGEQRFKGINEIKDMGGMAVYTDSLRINTLNPASYGQMQKATLSIGGSFRSLNSKTENSNSKSQTGSFDYFTLSIPVGKLGVAFGVMPYTFTGYKVENTTQSNGMTVNNQHTGEGGINRTFLGLGYKVSKRLSVGVDAAYLFGDSNLNTQKFVINNGEDIPLDRGSQIVTKNNYSGFDFNLGVNYKQPLTGKNFLHVNATFSPETTLTTDLDSSVSIIQSTSDGIINLENISLQKASKDLISPMAYTFGAGIGNPNKWFLGAEFASRNTEEYNKYFTYDNATYEDATKFSLGGFYTPKHNSFTSYAERMTYRAGINYEKTGLVLNSQKITDQSVHAGVGLPIGLNRTGVYTGNLNIGLEYGKRGTTKSNLIQENYFSLSIGISFNDRWFEKRKFD